MTSHRATYSPSSNIVIVYDCSSTASPYKLDEIEDIIEEHLICAGKYQIH